MRLTRNMSSVIVISALLASCLYLAAAEFTPFPDGGCGGTYRDEEKGTISSPGYPTENYPPDSNCTYIVDAPPNNVISFHSTFMDLEQEDELSESNCLYDHVTLYDEDDILGMYCGQQPIYSSTTTSETFKVEFVSDISNELRGFSIDWQVLNPEKRKISLNCNFDDPIPLCNGWNNANEDYLWIFTRGRSPSPNTGPLYDHTTNSNDGRYAFIEATGAEEGTYATLTSPAILYTVSSNKRCLNFWYHMHGSGTGNLTVTLDQTSGETEIVRLEGDKGQNWLEMNRTFTLTGLFATVLFKAFVGANYMSDIAIDDIKITDGYCSGDKPTDDDPMNGGGGSIPGTGRGILINNLVPTICLGNLIKFSCPKICDLTCEKYLNGPNDCARTCTGQCACPQDKPIFENGICVNASVCPTSKPITATTAEKTPTVPLPPPNPTAILPRDDLEKKKEIHEKLVDDFIAALLLYYNSTSINK